ncbi:MAG: hypothetical protein GXO28_03930 [Methanopyri archaeon]|nr:hypothetical protein [Methanopyri archaeon]
MDAKQAREALRRLVILLEPAKEMLKLVNGRFMPFSGSLLRDLFRDAFEVHGWHRLREELEEVLDVEVSSYADLARILDEISNVLGDDESVRREIARVRLWLSFYSRVRVEVLASVVRVFHRGSNGRHPEEARFFAGKLREVELTDEEAGMILPSLPDHPEELKELKKELRDRLSEDVVEAVGEERLPVEERLVPCVVKAKLPSFVDVVDGKVFEVPASEEGDLLLVSPRAADILGTRGKEVGGPFADKMDR